MGVVFALVLERINCFDTEIWGLWCGVRIIVKEVPIKVKSLRSGVMLRLYCMLCCCDASDCETTYTFQGSLWTSHSSFNMYCGFESGPWISMYLTDGSTVLHFLVLKNPSQPALAEVSPPLVSITSTIESSYRQDLMISRMSHADQRRRILNPNCHSPCNHRTIHHHDSPFACNPSQTVVSTINPS